MNNNYYCIIMAGGMGRRFWPCSRKNLRDAGFGRAAGKTCLSSFWISSEQVKRFCNKPLTGINKSFQQAIFILLRIKITSQWSVSNFLNYRKAKCW